MQRVECPLARRETVASEVLDGIGDAARGEWREFGPRAFHLRRRLSMTEERGIGPAIDIRGTREARVRVERLRGQVPELVDAWAASEAGV